MKFTFDNEWKMMDKNFINLTFFAVYLDKEFSTYDITILGFTFGLKEK